MQASGRDGSGEVRARLRVLATSDLHFHLLPYDYYADRPLAATGLAQAARLVRALRSGAGTSVLLDNGDVLQGTLLGDWLAAAGDGGGHPMIAAMNALGYDAGTLGNHDFNYGLPSLARALAEAAFPVVSANVTAEARGRPLVQPWTILERDLVGSDGLARPLRVGVIGFAPPQLTLWEGAVHGSGVVSRDIVEAAEAEVPRLVAAGADVVVALCHSGIGPDRHEPLMENAAVPLAAVEGIDALVTGHTHVIFPGDGVARTPVVDPILGTIHGKPAVQPGFFGSHVGVIDLALRWTRRGWRAERGAARAVPVARRAALGGPFAQPPLDDAIADLARPSHLALLEEARQPVGRTEVALQSYFSLVGADATLWVQADVERVEARRLLDGTPEADLPILAAATPYKAGGRAGPGHFIDVGPGPLALHQAADLCIYANRLCVVEIDGAGLKEWLERSAALFCRLRPGVRGQRLLDPQVPGYNFDVIDGLTYAIDLSEPSRTAPDGHLASPEAHRVRDLRHDGRPVANDDRFALVTNSYRIGSGGAFAAASRARVIARSPTTLRELLLAGLRERPLAPRPREGWRFASLDGATAWFDTGPGGLAHLAAAGARVAPEGPAPDGFWRFSIRL